ncbi:DUF7344 domain-containing protein [Halorussus halophilus]|uniref:DUF7344 domain-containing protein n=1 Tax=Halorussus halophilus TaxID=2650975 RepID=UPI00130188F9|nr:hypothetical protein [Halorussus halophilus]
MGELQLQGETDTVCSLLENDYRRRVLRCLERTETMTRDELSHELARDARPAASTTHTTVSLSHVHLPKLADENAIRYDTDAGTVTITAYGERLLRCLDAIETELHRRK